MKKFLSILLALAVGFTFTFGSAMSAFAATTTEGDYAYRVAKAQSEAENDLAAAYDYVVKSKLQDVTIDPDGNSLTIDAANTKDAVEQAYKDIKTAIGVKAENLKANELTANSYTYSEKEDFSTKYYINNDGTDTLATIDNSFADASEAITSANWDTKKEWLWLINDTSATKVADTDTFDADATYKKKAEGIVWYEKKEAGYYGDLTIAELKNAITAEVSVDYTAITGLAYNTSNATYHAYLAKAQFDADKAEALDVIAKIDLSMYGTDAIANDGYVTVDSVKYYNYNAAAAAVVAAYKADIEDLAVPAITADNKETVEATAKTNCSTIETFLAYLQEQTDENNIKTGKYEFKTTSGAFTTAKNSTAIKTAEKVAAENKTEEAGKAKSKAALASDIAAFLADETYLAATKSTNPTKAQYDDFLAAYETAHTYLIENTDIPYTAVANNAAVTNMYAVTGAKVVTNVNEAAKAIAGAATLKNVKNEDGKIKYDSEKIDANLKALLVYVYGHMTSIDYAYTSEDLTNTKSNPYETVKADIVYPTDYSKAQLKAALVVKAPKSEDNSTDYYVYNSKSYYGLEAKQIEAAMDTYKAAIDAANTDAELAKALEAFNESIGKIKDKTATDTLYATKLDTTAKAQADVLIAYAATLNAGKTGDALRDLTDYDAQAEWINWFKENDARTDAEITALYNAGVEMLNAIPTVGEAKTAKTDIEAKIAALPTNLTSADKAAVKEVYEAYVEYKGTYEEEPANLNTLRLAIYTVGKLEKADVEKLEKEVAKIKVLALTDKAQVKALAEAAEAYNADLEFEKMYTIASAPLTAVNVSAYTNAIRALELQAVKDQIAALPATVTEADKAAVEAARAAYDAFVAEYEVVANDQTAYDAKGEVGSIAKLTNAEATLATIAELTKWTDADAKAYVFDQTIKATSVKLSAKKVKVTANFDASKLVENGYTVEYKFYKSTKKSSGYKYTGVTKVEDAKTYTNTNAKKGKNYYKFKVVVKNADGTVILTTALKDCKYALRTIK